MEETNTTNSPTNTAQVLGQRRRRRLEQLLGLAAKEHDDSLAHTGDSELSNYWEGVQEGLREGLGEEIFTIEEITTVVLSRTHQTFRNVLSSDDQ